MRGEKPVVLSAVSFLPVERSASPGSAAVLALVVDDDLRIETPA
jgi:hypothetical protein